MPKVEHIIEDYTQQYMCEIGKSFSVNIISIHKMMLRQRKNFANARDAGFIKID